MARRVVMIQCLARIWIARRRFLWQRRSTHAAIVIQRAYRRGKEDTENSMARGSGSREGGGGGRGQKREGNGCSHFVVELGEGRECMDMIELFLQKQRFSPT